MIIKQIFQSQMKENFTHEDEETRISCSYLSFEVNKKTPFILLKAPLKTSNTARKYKESTSVRNQIVMCVMW